MALAPGASPQTLASVQRELGTELPREYVSFVLEANGGEGPVGDHGYAALYPVERVAGETRAYAGFDQFSDLIVFGSDMGGEAFCFDAAENVVAVGFISAPEDNIVVGSFTEFMRRLGAGTLL